MGWTHPYKIIKKTELKVERRKKTYIHSKAGPSVSFSLGTHKHFKQTDKTDEERKTWLNPGHLFALLKFGDDGETSFGGGGGGTGLAGTWQVEGGKPAGGYFLALAALAEFRGGVTGLPDPIPPPPP